MASCKKSPMRKGIEHKGATQQKIHRDLLLEPSGKEKINFKNQFEYVQIIRCRLTG